MIHFQSLELRNQAIVSSRMRDFEPFFLRPAELGEHGRWLWGGAMHVFQVQQRDLTRDLLIEWMALLVPDTG